MKNENKNIITIVLATVLFAACGRIGTKQDESENDLTLQECPQEYPDSESALTSLEPSTRQLYKQKISELEDSISYDGYFLHDITRNGTPELFIINYESAATATAYCYGVVNGSLKELGQIYAGNTKFEAVNNDLIALYCHQGYLECKKYTYKGENIEEGVLLQRCKENEVPKNFQFPNSIPLQMYSFYHL